MWNVYRSSSCDMNCFEHFLFLGISIKKSIKKTTTL